MCFSSDTLDTVPFKRLVTLGDSFFSHFTINGISVNGGVAGCSTEGDLSWTPGSRLAVPSDLTDNGYRLIQALPVFGGHRLST